MGSRRKEREDQFRQPKGNGYGSFSTTLVISANTLLSAALNDRKREVYRTRTDHFADNAVGAIALVVTALDVWMTECFVSLATRNVNEREQALKPIVPKYRALASLLGATVAPSIESDLTLLVDIRDEIIHHLTRPIEGEGNLPPWFAALHRRGVFLTTGQDVDFSLDQKLASYSLAYWAFRAVQTAVQQIIEGSKPEWRNVAGVASNFSLFATRCVPPERLAEFDAANALSLTPKNPDADRASGG